MNINVLLEKHSLEKNKLNKILFKNSDQIIDLEDQYSFNHKSLEENSFIYNQKSSSWFFNKKKIKLKNLKNIKIKAKKDNTTPIEYNGKLYKGDIHLKVDKNYIYIINSIDLELYVESVVLHEVYPHWPKQALEVAAIAARTYALYKKEEAIKKKRFFDIKNSIEHQKYDGFVNNKKVEEAVKKTKNKIISHKKKPILAMYHVCCGGIIPYQCMGYDFNKYPYLERRQRCEGCKNYKKYFWNTSITDKDFSEKLSMRLGKKVTKVKKITKKEYTKSGAIKKINLTIIGKNKKNKIENIEVKLKNKEIRKIFNINQSKYSYHFNIYFLKNKFFIYGRGQGHHIGLCQRGVEEYSKKGFSVKKIINFYYPETEIISIAEIEKI